MTPIPALSRPVKRLLLFIVLAAGIAAGVAWLYPDLLKGTPVERFVNRSGPLYQWQDAEGKWQVSDRPPPGDLPYEVKRFPLDANVMPSRTKDGEGD
jgi:hypothetical protein